MDENSTYLDSIHIPQSHVDTILNALVAVYNATGLEAEKYHLHLSDTILKLMGFVNDDDFNDRIYEGYVELAKRSVDIDISDGNVGFELLAKEIYTYLARRRPRKIKTESTN